MLEVVQQNPGLIIASLAISVPIVAIVFGTVTAYLTRVRKAEIEAGLKLEMLQRGMTAEEIKMVIEATPRKRGKHEPASA